MRIILDTILGQYNPVLDPVSGSAVLGVAGLDWSYIFNGFLFCILVYCFFRALGGWLSK